MNHAVYIYILIYIHVHISKTVLFDCFKLRFLFNFTMFTLNDDHLRAIDSLSTLTVCWSQQL